MRRLASLVVLLGAAACSSGTPPALAPDGGPDGEVPRNPGGARCCPRDTMMSGCMHLGGVDQSGCSVTCDFFCSTNWRVEVDEYGCERWAYDIRKPAPGETPACLPAHDAGTAPTCPQSVAALCASTSSCLPTWSAALASKPFPHGYPDLTYTCGSYDVYQFDYVDASELSYYDSASGALVAVIFNNGTPSCTAGPSDFVPPSCPNPDASVRGCQAAAADAGR
jgi:hypothetical protein